MKTNKSQPKIRISLTYIDWLVELISFALLVVLISLPLIYINSMPERIPVHFDINGVADGFGGKSTLWILPLTGAFTYLLLTIVSRFPEIYNFPVKITEENALVQYRLATRFIRLLKTVILILFLFLCHKTIGLALGKTSGLGKAFLPVFLILTFGPVIFYLVYALNNRKSS
jgi:uncharacterized membrane protein